jgi:hypothetical protein
MNCCEKCSNGKFSLVGEANSLYYVSDIENFKSIKLTDEIDGASIALELTSVDGNDHHTFLERFLNKKIEISIRVVE